MRTCDQPDAMLHAGRQPALQRYVWRQKPQAELCPQLPYSERRAELDLFDLHP